MSCMNSSGMITFYSACCVAGCGVDVCNGFVAVMDYG